MRTLEQWEDYLENRDFEIKKAPPEIYREFCDFIVEQFGFSDDAKKKYYAGNFPKEVLEAAEKHHFIPLYWTEVDFKTGRCFTIMRVSPYFEDWCLDIYHYIINKEKLEFPCYKLNLDMPNWSEGGMCGFEKLGEEFVRIY